MKDVIINKTVLQLNNNFAAKGRLTKELVIGVFSSIPGSLVIPRGEFIDVTIGKEHALLKMSYGRLQILG